MGGMGTGTSGSSGTTLGSFPALQICREDPSLFPKTSLDLNFQPQKVPGHQGKAEIHRSTDFHVGNLLDPESTGSVWGTCCVLLQNPGVLSS